MSTLVTIGCILVIVGLVFCRRALIRYLYRDYYKALDNLTYTLSKDAKIVICKYKFLGFVSDGPRYKVLITFGDSFEYIYYGYSNPRRDPNEKRRMYEEANKAHLKAYNESYEGRAEARMAANAIAQKQKELDRLSKPSPRPKVNPEDGSGVSSFHMGIRPIMSSVTCPKCGAQQNSTRHNCYRCGSIFIFDE